MFILKFNNNKANKTWKALKTITGITEYSLNGYNEYMIMFKTSSTILGTLIVPKEAENQSLYMKYVTDSGVTQNLTKSVNTWSVSNANYYGVIFGR